MLAAGKAIFFDGVTSAKRLVLIELAPDVLVIRDEEHRDVLAHWRYDRLDQIAAPSGLLRLGEIGAVIPARLEVRDPALASAIDEASVPVDRLGRLIMTNSSAEAIGPSLPRATPGPSATSRASFRVSPLVIYLSAP